MNKLIGISKREGNIALGWKGNSKVQPSRIMKPYIRLPYVSFFKIVDGVNN